MVEEMARQLSMATRRELKDAIRERYQGAAGRRSGDQILSEFERGDRRYHRKHALRVLKMFTNSRPSPRRREATLRRYIRR